VGVTAGSRVVPGIKPVTGDNNNDDDDDNAAAAAADNDNDDDDDDDDDDNNNNNNKVSCSLPYRKLTTFSVLAAASF
jgi:hypothetical protein